MEGSVLDEDDGEKAGFRFLKIHDQPIGESETGIFLEMSRAYISHHTISRIPLERGIREMV